MGRLALRARLVLAFLVPTGLALSCGGWLLYRATQQVLDEALGESLSAIAASAASSLRADRVWALTPDDAQGEGSRTFRSLKTQLGELQVATGLRRVLVFDTERRARLDVGGILPPLAEAPELLRDSTELQRVFAGERTASQVLFQGTDGRWYKTGYAPLRLDGQVVGAVAVEGTAAFFGPLTVLRNAFAGLGALTALLVLLAALASAQTLSRPLENLLASALRIGRGDLSTPVAPQPTREIGALATQLEAMRHALERRDAQLTMMLAGVAHEVKNPLGSMELFIGLLDEELRGTPSSLEEARSHAQHVRRALDYLKRIVDDFLAFARQQPLQRTTVDAPRLLADAVAHLQGEASSRNVAISVEAQPASLHLDERLVTSALVNLVKNALQASAVGQRVEVRGRVVERQYDISVHDAGGGIDAAALPRIFEPFFTTREQGTGLGLPLARKIAEAHFGALTASSRPGDTTFVLRLPLAGD